MSVTGSQRARARRTAIIATAALTLGAALVTAPAALAATEPVVLVGSLQSELGCEGDWDPACEATELTSTDGTVYTADFTVPKGSYALKVALGGGWDENYGAGGALAGADIPLVLEGDARLRFTFDDATNVVSFAPLDLAGDTTRADRELALDSLREPLTRERFYFVMADRFANGDPGNDTGGLTGGPLETGFDPTHRGFYHGGDLEGLTERLDYIEDLGTTAIWLTPSFKNKPVQGVEGKESAGYHGYWVTDFTQIDPHLGTNDDMEALVDAAHARGMKVFFDIITNHTADVIDYREGPENGYRYISKEAEPYRDAAGNEFDDRDYIGKPFPLMDPETSFPYTPFYPSPEDATVRVPEWLNDIEMYHNRGDSVWAGESNTYGDFIGLDDLFTERPEVVEGMGEIYKAWVEFGIDGFRVDTVKHVNMEFWQEFVPDILAEAERVDNDDFFAFGEVYDGNPSYLSQFTTEGKLQATIDFGFQAKGVDFAKGASASDIADFFALDDWYTDPDSNAYQLPTFLGNHDMGRVAMFLQNADQDEAEHLARVKLANSLMFLTRGNPVTYYGDEQGFVGTGGDQLARQDMFASQVDIYNSEDVLAGPSGAMDRYDTSHALYRHLADLAELREQHPALADGIQVTRYAADGPGLFVTSRYDHEAGVEYLVAINNSESEATATVDTWNKNEQFKPVHGTRSKVKTGQDQKATVTVAALSASVWRSSSKTDRPAAGPSVSMTLEAGATVGGRAEIAADIPVNTPVDATFLYRPVGTTDWQVIGTDDHAPFRVFHDVSDLPKGSVLEYRVVAKDRQDRIDTAGSWAIVGTAAPTGGVGNDPVEQPGAVSVPGTHNSEMGCTGEPNAGDWQPACDLAQLTLDASDGIWKGTWTIPADQHGYKAAIDRSWDENYGLNAQPNGDNIPYETDGNGVSFYYDHATNWVTSDAEGPILTAPGSFQTELGCSEDWKADCMRPWLQDPDGDGTYTFTTSLIPAGTWEVKVAHGLSWDENYGQGGVPNGSNHSFSVPSDGATTTFTYDPASHVLTITSG
ncbi:MAG: alpha-amylase family glycosyl hydrolase [Dermatophilaceae bacterium]